MSMTDRYLNKIYTARNPDETREIYDAWSKSYDAEVGENGYVTPARVADALTRHMDDLSLPILDFGCGTGLSGLALWQAGFTTIDGMDLSAKMLRGAKDKGLYRSLMQIGSGGGPPAMPGDYAAITAIGVLGAGAAPLSVFGDLVMALGAGGLLAFSFNDHTLEDPSYAEAVAASCDAGTTTLLFEELGPHLTGLNMQSAVYVLQKR